MKLKRAFFIPKLFARHQEMYTGSCQLGMTLYFFEEPYNDRHWFVSSKVDEYCCETLIFPANEEGVIQDWAEISGCKNVMNDHEALNSIGYYVENIDLLRHIDDLWSRVNVNAYHDSSLMVKGTFQMEE